MQLFTLAVLIICSFVHWSRHGNETLKSNWEAGQLHSAAEIAKAIYLGICIAFLGVTGQVWRFLHIPCLLS